MRRASSYSGFVPSESSEESYDCTTSLVTCRLVLRVVLKRLQVFRELGQPGPQQISKHGHVDRQAAKIVREITLGQDTLYQVDHHLHGRGLGPIHNLQNEGGQHVQALAIADRLVPSGETEQNPTEHRLIVSPSRAAKQTAPSSV